MDKNIKKIKKSLTIIFSVIVFVVVLIFWTTFFSIKYYREIRIEKQEFLNLVTFIESWKISINQILEFWEKFEGNIFMKKNWIWKWMENSILPPDTDFKPRWFINYVFINKEKLITYSNIKDEIEEDYIFSINDDESFLNIKQESWFLIKKFKNIDWDWTFIIFKKLRYGFSDYLNDILWFILLSLLFSLILYLIWEKFVNKAFIPVEENIKDMKDFIHNAWHELKTPISVMDSNIQLMYDLKSYDEDMIKELKREVLRLNSIIDSLIKLSDIDLFKDLEKNNLKEIVEEIINNLKFKIAWNDLKINIKIHENIIIKSNKDYFYMFLSNIIWNAIKYNKDWWKVDIIYKDNELIIKDNWIWISKKDIDKIFDRFYKADKSRNSDGFGIWLSLVRKIADIYKWKIKVESEKGEGTSFYVEF